MRFLFLVILVLAFSARGETTVFPGENWQEVNDVKQFGFDPNLLQKAKEYYKELDSASVMIIKDGHLISQWGDVTKKYLTHSIRKSFLSALYGKHLKNGTINIDASMEELSIDDISKLSDTEKKATIRDALKSRTGIFHQAEAESTWMHNKKPKRGTFRPGEFWVYNNWDFNVLGTIFEQQTQQSIFTALKIEIAQPIGMQDYAIEDAFPINQNRSKHKAYMFSMSARDMARFGLLMLNKGKWRNKQIVPSDWVDESTRYHSDASYYRQDGYGYMWWVSTNSNKFPHIYNADLPSGSYSAKGNRGQFIVVVPAYHLVVVHNVNTFQQGKNVRENDFGRLLQLILDAQLKPS